MTQTAHVREKWAQRLTCRPFADRALSLFYTCPTRILLRVLHSRSQVCEALTFPDLLKRVEAHSLVEDTLVGELRECERAFVQGREYGECMRTAAHDQHARLDVIQLAAHYRCRRRY
eukprot:scaffold53381_cov62-Phaeocystis_antarctica.AAC.5